MLGRTSRAALVSAAAGEVMLWGLPRSTTASVWAVERAKILPAYAEGRSITVQFPSGRTKLFRRLG